MVDHEPLASTQQFVGNHERTDGVVAGAAACIADDVRVPFAQPRQLGGIDTGIHSFHWSHPGRRDVPRSSHCGDTPHPGVPSAMSPCASGPHRSNYGSGPLGVRGVPAVKVVRLRIWLELFGGSGGRDAMND
jgi:hypothetical protein